MSFWLSDDFSNGVSLLLRKFTSSQLGVNPEELADIEGPTSADTLDSIKSIGDSPLSINVGVEDTMNVLEVVFWVFDDERHAMDNINLIFYSKYSK